MLSENDLTVGITREETPADIVKALNKACRDLERISGKLVHSIRTFECAEITEDGEMVLGVNLRWEVAVSEAVERIVDERYSDSRAPAIERLRGMAERRVMKEQPELYVEYHHLDSEIKAMRMWISAKKEAISGRQSALRAEGVLVGR